MIICVDRDRTIIVFRAVTDEAGAAKRQRVGVVQKKDFEIGPELESLSADEYAELVAVIATYREAAQLKARAAALNFPETVTAVLRYCHESASDDERKLIATALTEGLRSMRRSGREVEATEV